MGIPVITRALKWKWEAEKELRPEKCEGRKTAHALVILRMEGAMNQEVWAASWLENARTQILLQSLHKRRPYWHLDFSPVGPVLDFWPPGL